MRGSGGRVAVWSLLQVGVGVTTSLRKSITVPIRGYGLTSLTCAAVNRSTFDDARRMNYVFGKQRRFDMTTGLRYTVDNYRLSNNSITLGNENGIVVPVALDEKADKSKLRITSLGIPLHLAYHPVKQMTLSLSGYFDFTMGANSIYKEPQSEDPLSGSRTFQFGVGVGVTYYRCGVYFRYGVTPLFENWVGPKVHPLCSESVLDCKSGVL